MKLDWDLSTPAAVLHYVYFWQMYKMNLNVWCFPFMLRNGKVMYVSQGFRNFAWECKRVTLQCRTTKWRNICIIFRPYKIAGPKFVSMKVVFSVMSNKYGSLPNYGSGKWRKTLGSHWSICFEIFQNCIKRVSKRMDVTDDPNIREMPFEMYYLEASYVQFHNIWKLTKLIAVFLLVRWKLLSIDNLVDKMRKKYWP